jgi:simple sugar transport system ATP-binding protein
MVRKLSKQGKVIIFVSHKLEEVESLCSQIVVFRQGKNVGQTLPPYDTDKLVTLMFGKTLSQSEKKCEAKENINVEVEELEIDDIRLPIKNVNFCIQKGEVIGLAGMEGSGQGILLRALAGIIHPSNGHIWVYNEDLTKVDLLGKHYFDFKEGGISFLPADRLTEGLISGLDLREHFILSEKQNGFFINQKAAMGLTERRIKDFNIKGTAETKVEALSGGNQQRAELALLRQPLRLLLLDHPTRGLDIESSMYIWQKMKQRCKDGASVIFISSDLEEVSQYSDRILVFFGGRVSAALDASKVTVDQLGQLIGGKGWD